MLNIPLLVVNEVNIGVGQVLVIEKKIDVQITVGIVPLHKKFAENFRR